MSLLSATLGRILPKYRLVSEWAETYIKIVTAKPISIKTKANRLSYIKRITARFGGKRVGSVRPHDIAEYISELGLETPHLARRMLIELRDMFREALAYGWADRDPTLGVKTPRVKVARIRLTFSEWSEMYAFSLSKQPPWVSRMLVLALVTGQRRGDIRKLRFSDVWDEEIDGHNVPHLHIEQQKTGTRIAIPLTLRLSVLGKSVGDAITDCMYYAPLESSGDGFLLRKTTGLPPVVGSMSWRFEQAREMTTTKSARARTPPSLHECRSLAARLYDEQGVEDIQTLLGHTDASMTELYKDDRGLDKRSGRWKIVQT